MLYEGKKKKLKNNKNTTVVKKKISFVNCCVFTPFYQDHFPTEHFFNFTAQKYVDHLILQSTNASIDGFYRAKIVIYCSVGSLRYVTNSSGEAIDLVYSILWCKSHLSFYFTSRSLTQERVVSFKMWNAYIFYSGTFVGVDLLLLMSAFIAAAATF